MTALILLAACIGGLVLYLVLYRHSRKMSNDFMDFLSRKRLPYNRKEIFLLVFAMVAIVTSISFSILRSGEDAASETELSDARAAGYSEGHEVGYSEGYEAGEDAGYIVGARTGERRGYSRGYKDGAASRPRSDSLYIGNENSKKYHRSTCSRLPSEENRVFFDSASEAERSGYSPCSHCDP